MQRTGEGRSGRRTNRVGREAARLCLWVLPLWTLGWLLRAFWMGTWELGLATTTILLFVFLLLGIPIGYFEAARIHFHCRDGRSHKAGIPYAGLFLFTAVAATALVRVVNVMLSSLFAGVPLLYTPYFISWVLTWGLPLGTFMFERVHGVTLWVRTTAERRGLLNSLQSEYFLQGPSYT